MDTQKAQIIERLKQANNILVTVSANPTVDQLASAIGMTLLLNKLGKHATAVFSGQVPSVLEFLEPSKTIETNTDSLRDFIISLDKNKADKLRYKVEDDHVRIFITPYRTSISDKDLVFTQGDFNVEVVLALGITKQQDLDKAIAAHGRILHDATVIDISTAQVSGMGNMTLINPKASSLSEMLVDVGLALKPDVLDMQMATAFLTGIVAETNRFSNDKTTSQTMEVSSKLLAAGANQQLVATKLQPPKPPTPPPAPEPAKKPAGTPLPAAAEPAAMLPKPEPNKVANDGSLTIDHGNKVDLDNYELSEEDEQTKLEQIHIDDQGHLKTVAETSEDTGSSNGHKVIQPLSQGETTTESAPSAESATAPAPLEPPALGGTLTASGTDETEKAIDPLSASAQPSEPLLSHDTTPPVPATDNTTTDTVEQGPAADQVLSTNSLTDIERSVSSPHLQQAASQTTETAAPTDMATDTPSAPPIGLTVDEARANVDSLTSVSPGQPLPPIEALGAQYVDLPGIGGTSQQTTPEPTNSVSETPPIPPLPADQPAAPADLPASTDTPTVTPEVPPAPDVADPTAPPPVPPPMMPPSFTPTQSNS